MPALPLPSPELSERLSLPLVADRGPALGVRDVQLVGAADHVRVVLTVATPAGADGPSEAWEVVIPVAEDDLDPSTTPVAFVHSVRTKLEEWWHTRSYDPTTRSWGTLLPAPPE